MEKKNRKASSYWQEVCALFTKAGAFGIINVFYQDEINETRDIMKIKTISNSQSGLTSLGKDDDSELLQKVQQIAWPMMNTDK